MTTQPEALRLADMIDGEFDPDWMYEIGYDQISAELRRLQSENELLHKRCQQAYEVGRQSAQDDMDALLRHAVEALETRGVSMTANDTVVENAITVIRWHLKEKQ